MKIFKTVMLLSILIAVAIIAFMIFMALIPFLLYVAVCCVVMAVLLYIYLCIKEGRIVEIE